MKLQKPKFDFGVLLDKMFGKTLYLMPTSDGLQAIDITGIKAPYMIDAENGGGIVLDPDCIIRVRGIKRVKAICLNAYGSPRMWSPYSTQEITLKVPDVPYKIPALNVPNPNVKFQLPALDVECPECKHAFKTTEKDLELKVPDTVIDLPEIAISVPDISTVIPRENPMTERIFGDTLNYAEAAGRLQSEGNPQADKKQNMILLLVAGAVLIGILIFWKMNSGGK